MYKLRVRRLMWKFVAVFTGGFLASVAMFAIYARGRLVRVAGEQTPDQEIWAKAFEWTGGWISYMIAGALIGAVIVHFLRGCVFVWFQNHNLREVFLGISLSEFWLLISLLAFPVWLYVSYRSRYSDVLINGHPFYGPFPDLWTLYVVWFLFLQIPVLALCALIFSWKRMEP